MIGLAPMKARASAAWLSVARIVCPLVWVQNAHFVHPLTQLTCKRSTPHLKVQDRHTDGKFISSGKLGRRTWIYVCTIICAHFIHKTDPVTLSKGLFNQLTRSTDAIPTYSELLSHVRTLWWIFYTTRTALRSAIIRDASWCMQGETQNYPSVNNYCSAALTIDVVTKEREKVSHTRQRYHKRRYHAARIRVRISWTWSLPQEFWPRDTSSCDTHLCLVCDTFSLSFVTTSMVRAAEQ
jgi:hypothetical protein